MTVEDAYSNREQFAQKVHEVASTDLKKMGLRIVSFTIKEIMDKNGYLDALGQPQIATVKRDATIANAEREKEARIEKARAEKEAKEAEYQRDAQIAEAEKHKELKVQSYKRGKNKLVQTPIFLTNYNKRKRNKVLQKSKCALKSLSVRNKLN